MGQQGQGYGIWKDFMIHGLVYISEMFKAMKYKTW